MGEIEFNAGFRIQSLSGHEWIASKKKKPGPFQKRSQASIIRSRQSMMPATTTTIVVAVMAANLRRSQHGNEKTGSDKNHGDVWSCRSGLRSHFQRFKRFLEQSTGTISSGLF
jgi:hypothetical protein